MAKKKKVESNVTIGYEQKRVDELIAQGTDPETAIEIAQKEAVKE